MDILGGAALGVLMSINCATASASASGSTSGVWMPLPRPANVIGEYSYC